ncbi:hypothetical protein OQA88_8003 [Cercophora sp. LCS_1]
MAPYYYIHSTAYGSGYAFTVWIFDATDQSYINLNKTGGNKGGSPRTTQYWRFDRSTKCADSYQLTNYYRGDNVRLGVREGHRPYMYEAPPDARSRWGRKHTSSWRRAESHAGASWRRWERRGGCEWTVTVFSGITAVVGGTARSRVANIIETLVTIEIKRLRGGDFNVQKLPG